MMESILFASDLDQTLIYSRRTVTSSELDQHIRPVERLEDRDISYMTQSALRKLQRISLKVLFVPVTTRTKLQYHRIKFQDYDIAYQYAVTSNGGTILCNGREDKAWAQHVFVGRQDCLPAADLIHKFKEISHPSWVIEGSGKLADDLFYYCLIERDRIPGSELESFQRWSHENNWELSVQGRKLYLVPRNVNKNAAIQYIKGRVNRESMVAAGDSLLDLDLLKAADLAISPAHGELYALFLQGLLQFDELLFTSKSGIKAGEEILDHVEKSLSSQAVV